MIENKLVKISCNKEKYRQVNVTSWSLLASKHWLFPKFRGWGYASQPPTLVHCISFLSNEAVEMIVLIYLFKVISSVTSYKEPFTLTAQNTLFAQNGKRFLEMFINSTNNRTSRIAWNDENKDIFCGHSSGLEVVIL